MPSSQKQPQAAEHADDHPAGKQCFNMSKQYDLATKKANAILDYIRHSVVTSSREVILLLVDSVLMRPQLEFCVQFQTLQYKRNMDIWETVQ